MDQQDYFYGEVKHNYWKGNLKLFHLCTGKSSSEVLLFAEYEENMLCTEIVLNDKNNFCTQHVLSLEFSCIELIIQRSHIVG